MLIFKCVIGYERTILLLDQNYDSLSHNQHRMPQAPPPRSLFLILENPTNLCSQICNHANPFLYKRHATNETDPTSTTQTKDPSPAYSENRTVLALDFAVEGLDEPDVVEVEVAEDVKLAGRLDNTASATNVADNPVTLSHDEGIEVETPVTKFTAAHYFSHQDQQLHPNEGRGS